MPQLNLDGIRGDSGWSPAKRAGTRIHLSASGRPDS